MKTISFFNLKGGCGKTTSLINLGWLLAQREAKTGGRVLLIDADMQSESDKFDSRLRYEKTQYLRCHDGQTRRRR